jgi:serine/threonine-protein kinase HipA
MYRPVSLIEVRAWDKTVGAISLDSGTGYYVFEYAPAWQAGGIELAPLVMPVKEKLHMFPLLPEPTFMRLPAMLADAIPDDFGNALIDAWLAKAGVPKEAITPLDRLAYMGKRGMGALEFRPVRGPRHTKATAVEIATLVISSREALAGTIDGDRETQAAIMNLIQVGTSAGGARAKAVIAWNPDTNEIRSGQLPADTGFEHWLLKLDGVGEGQDLSSGKGYGRIEYAYYLMARAAGITISDSRLLEESGRAHFMTRRFDRLDGTKQHLQTLCAMQHLDYRQRSTHDYSQYFQTIKALNLPLDALAEAYRRMVFNVLASNCDDHTKNHSFLMDKTGKWHLAPAYDLIHAFSPDGEWTWQHLMSVNGKFRNINRSDFHAVGDRFLIPDYKGIIRKVTAAISCWPEFAAASGLPIKETERIQNDFRIES